MKKIILTVLMASTFGFVNAQEKEEMSFGAKGGLNLATVTNIERSKTLVGFHVGFFGEFMLSDKFALQPELLYSAQGSKFEAGDLKLGYVNIPVMLKYYVADDFSLELGPQIGFLVSAKSETDNGVTEDVKDTVKSTDVGVNFGLGYDLTENFMIGLRYNYGLTRLQEELEPGEAESKNSVFQFSLGYRF